jgi:chemotaxis protein histidine kinase CheA
MATIYGDLTGVFIQEAESCLSEMDAMLVVAESKHDTPVEIWRGAHTIRGNAAMMGYDVIVHVATVLERLGKAAADRRNTTTPGMLQLMRLGIDTIRRELEVVKVQRTGALS